MGSLLKSSGSSSCNFHSVKMLSICSSWMLIRHPLFKEGLSCAGSSSPCALMSWRNIYFMISNTYTPWYLVLGELNLVLKNACCLRLQIETTATLKEIWHQKKWLRKEKAIYKENSVTGWTCFPPDHTTTPYSTLQMAKFLFSCNFMVIFTFLIRKSPHSYFSMGLALHVSPSFSF